MKNSIFVVTGAILYLIFIIGWVVLAMKFGMIIASMALIPGLLAVGGALMTLAAYIEGSATESFYVKGGVYKDFTFTEMEDGTAESYGPFSSYEEARGIWSSRARFMVDNACHRLTIERA